MIKGVISDMDGVILDSEILYVRFWCEAANYYGFPMQKRHALAIRSMARPFAVQRLQGFFGDSFDYDLVRDKRVELMDAYVNEHGIQPKKGARRLLEYLKQNGYPVALATATAADRAKGYLERVDLLKYFDVVASARMVKNGKPEPDIYLYAANQLGLKAEECLALEDSVNGVKSAFAAGCKTVLVPDLDNPENELRPLLYDTADGLEDVIRILS
ncbi:MAG TPA: HAD family hydrolase [Ruminococcaceae bacterium]|nr:HAD family hydrolase [Oscillospiraceae bacterium]